MYNDAQTLSTTNRQHGNAHFGVDMMQLSFRSLEPIDRSVWTKESDSRSMMSFHHHSWGPVTIWVTRSKYDMWCRFRFNPSRGARGRLATLPEAHRAAADTFQEVIGRVPALKHGLDAQRLLVSQLHLATDFSGVEEPQRFIRGLSHAPCVRGGTRDLVDNRGGSGPNPSLYTRFGRTCDAAVLYDKHAEDPTCTPPGTLRFEARIERRRIRDGGVRILSKLTSARARKLQAEIWDRARYGYLLVDRAGAAAALAEAGISGRRATAQVNYLEYVRLDSESMLAESMLAESMSATSTRTRRRNDMTDTQVLLNDPAFDRGDPSARARLCLLTGSVTPEALCAHN